MSISINNMKILNQILSSMPSISLEEMNSVKLMNRIDTKYLTHFNTFIEVLNNISKYYFVQENCYSRIAQYQTVYFDTIDHHFYMQHHNGKGFRNKIRVRRYCDTNQLFCEIKMKSNKGRTKKKRVEIPNDQFYDFKNNNMVQQLIQKEIKVDFYSLIPSLENQFKRITLVNLEKTERLTIDFDIHFINHETNIKRYIKDLVIIELKQDGRSSSPFKQFMLDFPIYEKSFSKYCIGTVVTNPIIKSNNFKSRIRFIENKIHTPFNS